MNLPMNSCVYALCQHVLKEQCWKITKKTKETKKTTKANDALMIHANHIDRLVDKQHTMTYQQCMDMAAQLCVQLEYLLSVQHCAYYGFDLSSVLCIDGQWLFCSPRYLLPLDRAQTTITLLYPSSTLFFSNSDVQSITQLPASLPATCAYPSLAYLILYCLEIQETKETKENTDNTIIPPWLSHTKLYWFLHRCIHEQLLVLI